MGSGALGLVWPITLYLVGISYIGGEEVGNSIREILKIIIKCLTEKQLLKMRI